jgi:hypothetical protein
MSLTKKIAWEKWEDEEEQSSPPTVSHMNTASPYPEEEEEDSGIDITELYSGFISEMPTIVSTPVGMYRLQDRMSPTNQFDCWMGYTNFDITEEVKNTIESIKGVELLVVLTRYRFFLGVAKLFNFRDVRVEIENNLCNRHVEQINIQDDEIREKVEDLQNRLSSEYKHWAIFVFPNGGIDYTFSDDSNDDSFIERMIQ